MHADTKPYARFTGPHRLHKALSTLEGLLIGLSADHGCITDVAPIVSWLDTLGSAAARPPFSEFAITIHDAARDGILDSEEIADIIWLARKLQSRGKGFAGFASDMQRLQGILAGVIADGVVTMREVSAVRAWLDAYDHLRWTWPYAEVQALLQSVVADGVIDADEQRALLEFFGEFALTEEHRAVSNTQHQLIGGRATRAGPSPATAERSRERSASGGRAFLCSWSTRTTSGALSKPPVRPAHRSRLRAAISARSHRRRRTRVRRAGSRRTRPSPPSRTSG